MSGLGLVDRYSYGAGGAVFAVKEAAYAMFVLLFYTQVLGLGGTATGLVLFLALMWDAVSDPVMGAWSDRFDSRWGRRHPFMVVSALPLGLGMLALFYPPAWVQDSQTLLAGWLLLCSLWVRTAVTVFALPQLALAAEITSDYHERSRLLGVRAGFVFMVSVMLPALSMLFIFGEHDGVDGRFVAENYISYGWISALLVWLSASVTIIGTRKYAPLTRVDTARMPGAGGVADALGDFLSTLRNPNFRNLLYYDLAASASYGITITLNVMAWTYYWELSAAQLAYVLGLPVFLAVPAALASIGPLGRRLAKHDIMKWAMALMLVDIAWLYPLRFLFDVLPDNGHWSIPLLLLLQNLFYVYLFVLRNVSCYSIVADLTDEQEEVSGKRQEGSIYSVISFTGKLAAAAGPLYAGVALDVVGLNEGMLPGSVPQATLDGLVWAMALGITPLMLIAWFFTYRVHMSEARLAAIQARIAAREASLS